MSRSPVIEVCCSADWIYQNVLWPSPLWGYYEADVAMEMMAELRRRLIGVGYVAIVAGHGRTSRPGWDGAKFRHRIGVVGTFAELTVEQVSEIQTIAEDVIAELAGEIGAYK